MAVVYVAAVEASSAAAPAPAHAHRRGCGLVRGPWPPVTTPVAVPAWWAELLCSSSTPWQPQAVLLPPTAVAADCADWADPEARIAPRHTDAASRPPLRECIVVWPWLLIGGLVRVPGEEV